MHSILRLIFSFYSSFRSFGFASFACWENLLDWVITFFLVFGIFSVRVCAVLKSRAFELVIEFGGLGGFCYFFPFNWLGDENLFFGFFLYRGLLCDYCFYSFHLMVLASCAMLNDMNLLNMLFLFLSMDPKKAGK